MRRTRAGTPAWTDHDVSDPGITLLEVLAFGLPVVVVVAGAVVVARRRRRGAS